MKYCTRCGNPMEDTMLFCQKCGTKAPPAETAADSEPPKEIYEKKTERPIVQRFSKRPKVQSKKNKKKTASIVCFFLAAICAFNCIAEPQFFVMTVFFSILGGMFLVLSKSPKENKYILGKSKGLRKIDFIILCAVGAFLLFGVIAGSESAPDQEAAGQEEHQQEDAPRNEENDLFSDVISDADLRTNFVSACEATGIDIKEIKHLEKVGDWVGGPRYSFTYSNASLLLYCNTDSTVNTIKLGTDTDIYKEGYEPYQIEDYLVSPVISSNLRPMVEDLVKGKLNYPKTAHFPWIDWAYGRDHKLYSVSATVIAQNAFGVEEEVPFKAIYYVDGGTTALKYFEMNGTALINKMDSVFQPERKPVAVEGSGAEEDAILLVYGQLGKYGKEIQIDGEKEINYHVPAGSYMLTSKVNYCVVYISSDKYYKDSDGYTTNDNRVEYTFGANGQSKDIVVKEGEHIELTINARVVLTPQK